MTKAKSSSIEESWTRINQWLRSEGKAANLAKKLLPGVPEEALERVEKGLGVKLPADSRQFWQVCGGSRPDKGAEETDDEPWWQPGEWSSDIFPRSIPETMAFSVLSPVPLWTHGSGCKSGKVSTVDCSPLRVMAVATINA